MRYPYQFPYTILVPHMIRASIVEGVGHDTDDLHMAYEVTDADEEAWLMQHVAERKGHQWTTVLALLRTARRTRQIDLARWLRHNHRKLPAVPVMAALAAGDEMILSSLPRS
jgi:hypothetical protein